MSRMDFATLILAAAAGAALVGARPASAQTQTGSILIKVADEQGAVLPGVTVIITSSALVLERMTGTTDATGAYRFPSLPPGLYAVRSELPGFRTVMHEGVIVSTGQTTPVEAVLTVAAVQESVTVTGSATIDTTSANVNVMLNQALLQKTPGGRDIWSLVEYKVPGLITNRPDVGGAAGGLQAAFSARGTPNGQNVQHLNGINVGDPAAIGFTQFYYDFDAFEEIQVSTGAHDLSVPSGGVFLNMVTKTGGDVFAGRGAFFWQGDPTQGTNVDADLSRLGFARDAGAVKYISDATLQLGGPIVPRKVRLFTAFRDWRVHVNVPAFAEVEQTNITSGIGNVTWQVDRNNKVTGFVSRQYYKKPNRGAGALNEPVSVWNEDDVTSIYQALWNSVLTQRLFMDARVSYNKLFFPLFIKGDGQSLFDSSTGFRSRANSDENIFTRRRLQASATMQYFVEGSRLGRHELRWGIDHAHAPTRTTVNRNDDVNLTFDSASTSAVPEVQFFNSPVDSRSTVDATALFVQDTFSYKRLTVSGGVRWERIEGYLPEQGSPPSRWFPDAERRFGSIRGVPLWHDLAPRLSIIYDLSGRGRTIVKAAAARYLHTLGTGTPNSVNPNFTASETYQWLDRNGDLTFQDGERGNLLGRAGALLTSIDPAIERPRTDELLAGVDHELFANTRLSAVFTYRQERNLFGSIDVGLPGSAYRLVTRVDPGRDGQEGTADDGTASLFDQDPSTLGQNRFVVTNTPALNQLYRGVEVTASRRLSARWQMLAGYTASQTIVNALVAQNPNTLINGRGPVALDRTHTFKVSGTYIFPREVAVSANVRTQTGEPVTRQLRYRLTQGFATINAEPRGSVRLDPLTSVDLRIAKTVRLRGRELDLMLDAYNLTNANTAWEVQTLTGRRVLAGGPAIGEAGEVAQFLLPTQILAPRIFRLGATFRF